MTAYPDESTWTVDNPPPAVRVAGSQRIHATTVMLAGTVLFPACGTSLGQPVRRIPVTDPTTIDCLRCTAITEGARP